MHGMMTATIPDTGEDAFDVVDANHRTIVRMNYLTAQHRVMTMLVRDADAKAAAILAVVGLLAARGPVAVSDAVAAGVPTLAYIAFLGITLALALATLFPRYIGPRARRALGTRERWSWLALSPPQAAPFDGWFEGAEVADLERSLSRSNEALARVLLRKYRTLRIAFAALVGVIAALAVVVTG